MIVSSPRYFFLSAVLLLVLAQSSAKILPSLLASFNKLTPSQQSLSGGSMSHLSKNFREESKKVSHEPLKISKSLISTPQDDAPADRNLGAAENYAAFDVNFETTEIKDVLSFIEYKMNEITSLVQECIDREYAADVSASVDSIRHECVGTTYQIIFFNYNEGLKKIKEVLMEILKLKLQNLKEDYEDETNFFLDILESLINKDYSIPKSLELAKKASKYYVSPRYFDRLVALTNPEIQAFTTLHERLKEQRSKIQEQLRQKEQNEEEFIDAIERKARMLKRRNAGSRKMRALPKSHSHSGHQSGYLHGLKLAARPVSPAPVHRMSPQELADNDYLNNVASQIDNLSLYRNPAMPQEDEHQQSQTPFMIPAQAPVDDFMVKKV